MKRVLISALVIGLGIGLASCDKVTPTFPVTYPEPGQFTVYRLRTENDYLYVVKDATTTFNCGKGCMRSVAGPTTAPTTPSDLVASAINKLSPEEITALGIDAKVVARAKLSPEERKALGIE